MNILVNFSSTNFKNSRLRLNNSALKFGVDIVQSFDENFIKDTDFFHAHRNIFQNPKGFGYWIWKPFLINEALNSANEGDIIIYSDAGIEIIDNLSPLISICRNKAVVLFANGRLKNKLLIKRDCYILMGCDEKKYWYGPHVDASFGLFQNVSLTRAFVSDWLNYCSDIRIISDQHNLMGKKNFFGFHFHRHDQAVLSLLAVKSNIELFRQASQYGNHFKMPEFRVKGEINCISQFKTTQVNFYSKQPFCNSPYFQLLDHHRKKVEEGKSANYGLIKNILRSGNRKFLKFKKLLKRQ